ncbi:MAG: hypothetical protein C0600_07210 [Ignavibacteria bacterium]|nr:MAG: hypothetical protein C0600_07210 [Ignavibacteria bacterium]
MKEHAAIFAWLLRNAEPPFLFWRAPDRETWITAGAVRRWTLPQSADWRQWLREKPFSASPQEQLPRVAVLGFGPAAAAEGEWDHFPMLEVVDPILGYHQSDGQESFIGLDEARFPEEMSAGSGVHVPEQAELRIQDWGAEEYRRIVAEGLDMIHGGQLEKIVLARSVTIDLRPGFDPARAIVSLQHQPHSFSLLYSPDGERFFLSATPERLGRIRDGRFATMALAGTLTSPEGEAQDRDLLSDAKERAEHAYVVDMIRREAGAFCESNIEDSVRLLKLPHVTHILTQFEGRVREGRGMGDVMASLHPTPAVAGTPRDAAVAGISALESFDRGLYAGCIGWVDSSGNGDAAVTIRSAVVNGGSAIAFAGAGIVEGSDPDEEEHETRAKLQTVLDILGS